MADPLSLIGTVSALLTLPGAVLESIDTLNEFVRSARHAPKDVERHLMELNRSQTLCLALEAQSHGLYTHSSNNISKELWRSTLEDMDSTTNELRSFLQGMQADLNGPSHRKLKARIQKYLSRGKVEEIKQRLFEFRQRLSLLMQSEMMFVSCYKVLILR